MTQVSTWINRRMRGEVLKQKVLSFNSSRTGSKRSPGLAEVKRARVLLRESLAQRLLSPRTLWPLVVGQGTKEARSGISPATNPLILTVLRIVPRISP